MDDRSDTHTDNDVPEHLMHRGFHLRSGKTSPFSCAENLLCCLCASYGTDERLDIFLFPEEIDESASQHRKDKPHKYIHDGCRKPEDA
ncbi:hypothetical protein SDC9_108190 [bioreactor metagenome]|uniref:Uncharacterized protein n=1 Tax=bioreactor metagenome TaxID=1076179 RepID=A0A645B7E0_9ZZZZ